MSKQRWPKEWPGFETEDGFIVEAMEIETNDLFCRSVAGRQWRGGPMWLFVTSPFNEGGDLKPLTEAARQVLAIAKVATNNNESV